MVFSEAAFDGKLLLLAVGFSEADLAGIKDSNDGGMVLQEGKRPYLARHRDGTGFTFKQGIARGDDFDVHCSFFLRGTQDCETRDIRSSRVSCLKVSCLMFCFISSLITCVL